MQAVEEVHEKEEVDQRAKVYEDEVRKKPKENLQPKDTTKTRRTKRWAKTAAKAATRAAAQRSQPEAANASTSESEPREDAAPSKEKNGETSCVEPLPTQPSTEPQLQDKEIDSEARRVGGVDLRAENGEDNDCHRDNPTTAPPAKTPDRGRRHWSRKDAADAAKQKKVKRAKRSYNNATRESRTDSRSQRYKRRKARMDIIKNIERLKNKTLEKDPNQTRRLKELRGKLKNLMEGGNEDSVKCEDEPSDSAPKADSGPQAPLRNNSDKALKLTADDEGRLASPNVFVSTATTEIAPTVENMDAPTARTEVTLAEDAASLGEGKPEDRDGDGEVDACMEELAESKHDQAYRALEAALTVWRKDPKGEDESAVRNFRKAAIEGKPLVRRTALHELGVAYATGRGIRKQRTVAALRVWEEAAKMGDPASAHNAATMFEEGRGTPIDMGKAISYYMRAVQMGNADSATEIGRLLGAKENDEKWSERETGKGEETRWTSQPRNPTESVKWYRYAATKGSARAQEALGDAYRTGEGIEGGTNPIMAAKWYRIANGREQKVSSKTWRQVQTSTMAQNTCAISAYCIAMGEDLATKSTSLENSEVVGTASESTRTMYEDVYEELERSKALSKEGTSLHSLMNAVNTCGEEGATAVFNGEVGGAKWKEFYKLMETKDRVAIVGIAKHAVCVKKDPRGGWWAFEHEIRERELKVVGKRANSVEELVHLQTTKKAKKRKSHPLIFDAVVMGGSDSRWAIKKLPGDAKYGMPNREKDLADESEEEADKREETDEEQTELDPERSSLNDQPGEEQSDDEEKVENERGPNWFKNSEDLRDKMVIETAEGKETDTEDPKTMQVSFSGPLGDMKRATADALNEAVPRGWQANDSFKESPLEGGALRTLMMNVGGNMTPWTKGGKFRTESRIGIMSRIILADEADLILAVEAHVAGSAAHDIAEYAGQSGCFATSAPTTGIAAATIGEGVKRGRRIDPAAGIVAVMSQGMKMRLRGNAERKTSGRLLHLTFGDGASEEEDKHPTHVVACYGLSAQSEKSGARAQMAMALARDLREILERPEYKGHHFLVYADTNSVQSAADRTSGKMLPYDKSQFALTKVLNDPEYGLVDLMVEAHGNSGPPKTYIKGLIPTSRIDMVFASRILAKQARTGTSSTLGELSATHLPLGCSFTGEEAKGVAQDETFKSTCKSAVAIMASVGGRKWNLNKELTEMYKNEAFENDEIKQMFTTLTAKYTNGLATAGRLSTNGMKERAAEHEAAVEAELYKELADAMLHAEHWCRQSSKKTKKVEKAQRKEGQDRKNQDLEILQISTWIAKSKEIYEKSIEIGRRKAEDIAEGVDVDVLVEQVYAAAESELKALNKKLISIHKLLAERADYPISPKSEPNIKRDAWKDWTLLVVAHATKAMASVGRYEGNSAIGENFEKQKKGPGQTQVRDSKYVMRMVGGKHGDDTGKLDMIVQARGDGEVKLLVRLDELGEHVKRTQQELGFKLHWTTKALKRAIFSTEGDGSLVNNEEALESETTEMIGVLRRAITTMTTNRMGRSTIESALNEMRDATGLDIPEHLKKEVAGETNVDENNTDAISQEDGGWNPSEELAKWVAERRAEAFVIIRQLQKAPGLAKTMRDVKPAAAGKKEEVAAAFKSIKDNVDVKELRRMLVRCNSGKAGGPSGITREHLLHAPEWVLEHFVPIVNNILDGTCSDRLKLGCIIPLIKDEARYRPVALLETVWKCCMTLISDRLLDVLQKFSLLSGGMDRRRRQLTLPTL